MTHQQALFEMVTDGGAELSFVVLDDDQCAITRDGLIVEVHSTEDANLGRALKKYFKMVEECGGARHPFQVLEECAGHQHAG